MVRFDEGNKRISSRVPPEINEKLDKWSVELGLNKSQFISLCVQAGLQAVVGVLRPEEAFSAAYMAKVANEATKMKNTELVSDLDSLNGKSE